MKTADYWIGHLNLEKHPEGGYFREIYRSNEEIPGAFLPDRYVGNRSFSTSIYYLLKSGEISMFHRLKTDEIWHFYEGSCLELFVISPEGVLTRILLGNKPEKGEKFQALIEKGNWFAAGVKGENSFTLMGCTVAPGFDFRDFEPGNRNLLLNAYPAMKKIIMAFTYSSY